MSPAKDPASRIKQPPERSGIAFLRRKPSRVQLDFDRLTSRVQQRLYPETSPVLASYWLKTVYWSGYTREEWRELDRLLKRSMAGDSPVSDSWRQVATDIRSWIKSKDHRNGKPAASDPRASLIRRPSLGPETSGPYMVRLLNTWLPQEVARMLVSEPPDAGLDSAGVPVLAIGKALERLLLRERLSPSTLEALLDPHLVSARFVYPADLEMLRDVILFLLGQTAGLTPAVLPATFLGTPRDARISGDTPEAAAHASLLETQDGEELHIPITPSQVMQILTEAPLGIASIVVTMDGRWWEAGKVQGGGEDIIVYRPQGRPRIDYSADHARLRVPWPEPRPHWSGIVHFPNEVEVFGRQWKVAQWERDGDRAWLHLIFSRPAPVTLAPSAVAPDLRRCRPASIDLAWAELETALAAALDQNQWDPIERLQREDLIPLGRALFALAQSALDQPQVDRLESNLRRVHYTLGSLDSFYGSIPWRILPPAVRKVLLRGRIYSRLVELLQQAFGGLPAASRDPLPIRYLTRLAGR